jgi:hypothetical protein
MRSIVYNLTGFLTANNNSSRADGFPISIIRIKEERCTGGMF